jgi:type II secretory pathway pseudopilin PulG
MTELLVVVGIIGILAGLLLPVLSRAKAQVRRSQCINNLKQLSLTWTLYADDHGDAVVPNGHGIPSSPELKYARLWVLGDTHFYHPAYTNADFLLDTRYAAFAAYLKSAALYKCPEDKSSMDAGESPGSGSSRRNPKIRSYSLNGYMGWAVDKGELTRGYKIFLKRSDMTGASPSALFVFQDVHPDNLCFPAFMVNMPSGGEGFFHYPSGLHNRRGVLVFADGHTESHRWQDSRTMPPVTGALVAHWDPSPDNPDLDWIRKRTTYRAEDSSSGP